MLGKTTWKNKVLKSWNSEEKKQYEALLGQKEREFSDYVV